jgi:YHS domain-containing protein
MKNMKFILAVVLTATLCAFSFASRADDSTNAPAKTYPLKTCLVCGMELGMMDSKPYMFVYKGQEIKLCDKSEKADFDKNPDKYMKKLADAEAKLKK